MPTIKFSDNPNEETAFVTQDGGQRNRAVLTAALNGTIKYPDNPNSTKVIVTVDGVEHKAVAVADIAGGGGGGSSLPSQTGHSGEFLTTDGTDASWAAVESLPSQTGQSGKFLTTDGTDASWSDKPIINNINNVNGGISILGSSSATGQNSILIGANAGAHSNSDTNCIVVGATSKAATNSIAMGNRANADANACVQINLTSSSIHNTDTGTVKIANGNGNFEIMSADGTIPEGRLADTTNAQEGDVLTLDSTGNAVWQAGVSGLPDQTGQSGKFLTTDGTDASWGTVNVNVETAPTVNTTTRKLLVTIGTNVSAWQDGFSISYNTFNNNGVINLTKNPNSNKYNYVAIGINAQVTADGSVAVGAGAQITAYGGIAIGRNAVVSAQSAIQLSTSSSSSSITNSDANTFKVANNNGNYEIMSADGTVPTARLTKVNTTATLAVADWSSSTQTVTVSGVKADSVVFVSPAPASASDYASAGILCTSQSADSLTFTATTTPSVAIDVNIVCL